MKRISYLLASVALLFGAAGMAAAQENASTEVMTSEEIRNSRRYEVGTFNDNWSIGIGGGVNMYMGEHDRQMKFNHRLSPAADLYVAKWFTPIIGFRLGYTGAQFIGATNQQTGYPHTTGTDYPNSPDRAWLHWQKWGFFNIHADFMLNLVNLIGGYKERVYNLSPYFGVGLIRSYQTPVATKLSGNVGILNTFRLCDALDLNIDIRGTLVPEDFDGEGGVRPGANYGGVYASDGFLTASIGLAYKFNPRGWVQGKDRHYLRTERTTVKVTDDAALAALQADNAALQQALAKAESEMAVIKELHHMPGYLVTFEINKSILQNKDRVNLGKIADALKNTGDTVKLLLTGYADEGTGTVKINDRLSRERAQAVFDCLVNEFGVDPAKLETDFKGGVANMFYDDAVLSRSVIVSIK
ncbi:MAG: OmpA family protein [Bacteroidales bacterium]|nr:OmpA family protein [Bacteroidales bacterium]